MYLYYLILMFIILLIILLLIGLSKYYEHHHKIITCEKKIKEIVSSKNSTVMNIYYINLQKSKDRNQRFLNDIIDYNTFNAIRIDAVSPETLPEMKKSDYYINKYLKNTEYACLASHFKAIHTAYHNNEKYAMICEDDAIIENIDYTKLVSTAPDDWEILQLHFFSDIFFDYKRIRNLYNTGNVLWIPFIKKSYSAACYIINHKAMYRILSQFVVGFENPIWNEIIKLDYSNTKSLCVADFVIYEFLNTYTCIYPFVNTYQSHKSTIDDSHTFFNGIFMYIKSLYLKKTTKNVFLD